MRAFDKCDYVNMRDTRSRPKLLNNGLLQGSVLAPLLFNLYVVDLSQTPSRKFMYADDLALAIQHSNMGNIEASLSADLDILSDYFRKWRIHPALRKPRPVVYISTIDWHLPA